MTILRQGRQSKYSAIPNDLARNGNLSFGAVGLLVHLLSLPSDWKIYISQLVGVRKEGRQAILTLLKELKAAGYVHLAKNGFKGKWEYHVFDEPISEEEFKKSLRTIRLANCSPSELFANQHLQIKKEHTNEKLLLPQTPSRKKPVKQPPPSKEEEEELRKRRIERDNHSSKPVSSESKWRETVLSDIRASKSTSEAVESTISQNMTLAKAAVKQCVKSQIKGIAEASHRQFEIAFEGNCPPFVLEYTNPCFREKLIAQLKRMKVPLDGL